MTLELQLVYGGLPLPPNYCARCRATEVSREYYVDTGIDTEIEGIPGLSRIYICNSCMKDFIRIDPQAWFRDDFESTKEVLLAVVEVERSKNYNWQFAVDVCEAVGIDLEHLVNVLGDSIGAERKNKGITTGEGEQSSSTIESNGSDGTAAVADETESGADVPASKSLSFNNLLSFGN